MPLEEHDSRRGIRERETWLEPVEHDRARPWAYEELLFGNPEGRGRSQEIATVVRELEAERAELIRLHVEFEACLARVAVLDRRLRALAPRHEGMSVTHDGTSPTGTPPGLEREPRGEPDLERERGWKPDLEREPEREPEHEPELEPERTQPRATFPHPRPTNGNAAAPPRRYDRRSRLLARCEGFDVEAPAGPVGVVEGVRFVSRIDRPDLLEVRGGRFGRQLILVPIEDVAEIQLAEERVVLRSAPALASDFLDELGGRLRRVLHGEWTPSP